jgi:hypothetical protein
MVKVPSKRIKVFDSNLASSIRLGRLAATNCLLKLLLLERIVEDN